jgi:hypothetical protein
MPTRRPRVYLFTFSQELGGISLAPTSVTSAEARGLTPRAVAVGRTRSNATSVERTGGESLITTYDRSA